MSDLGSDAGSTTLSLLAKIFEAILQMINKIYETWKNAPDRELKKYQAEEAKEQRKEKIERKEALKELDGKTGYVNHELLKKTGEPLHTEGMYLTREDIELFNACARREGVVFSAVSNEQLKQEGEKAYMQIEYREADAERILRAVNRMNEEKRIQAIDGRIKEIQSKGEENLTPQDYVNLRELIRQKEEIQRGYTDRLNGQMQETIIHNAAAKEGQPKLEPMNISEALNRLTGRSIDKDQYSIIADAHDPSKIVKCHGYEDTDPVTGKPYIKTEYEVYHGDECLLKTHDGRFEGRPSDYWVQEKAKIEKAADFSGEYYKFFTPQEYEQWAQQVHEQNRDELSEMEKPPEEKDYDICRKDAEAKLEENGAEIRDGVVVNKESGRPMMEIVADTSLSAETRTNAAECVVIGRQLETYNTIESLQNHMDYVKSQVILASPGSEEYAAAMKEQENTQEQLEAAYKKDMGLVDERKSVNAAQSIQQTEQERQKEQEQEVPTLKDVKAEVQKKTGQEQTEQEGQEQEKEDIEHPDERREERVDEIDPRQQTMEEWKGEIEQAKAKEGAKQADVKDRDVHDQTKVKAPKPKERD